MLSDVPIVRNQGTLARSVGNCIVMANNQAKSTRGGQQRNQGRANFAENQPNQEKSQG